MDFDGIQLIHISKKESKVELNIDDTENIASIAKIAEFEKKLNADFEKKVKAEDSNSE